MGNVAPKNCWSCTSFIENPYDDEHCMGVCNRNCDVSWINRDNDLEEKECWSDK